LKRCSGRHCPHLEQSRSGADAPPRSCPRRAFRHGFLTSPRPSRPREAGSVSPGAARTARRGSSIVRPELHSTGNGDRGLPLLRPGAGLDDAPIPCCPVRRGSPSTSLDFGLLSFVAFPLPFLRVRELSLRRARRPAVLVGRRRAWLAATFAGGHFGAHRAPRSDSEERAAASRAAASQRACSGVRASSIAAIVFPGRSWTRTRSPPISFRQ